MVPDELGELLGPAGSASCGSAKNLLAHAGYLVVLVARAAAPVYQALTTVTLARTRCMIPWNSTAAATVPTPGVVHRCVTVQAIGTLRGTAQVNDLGIIFGCAVGFIGWFVIRYVVTGFFTVDQNERAVKTRFGRAERVGIATTIDDPIAKSFDEEERQRYCYPQVRVIPPGGPYFKWPWEEVRKVNIATQTMNMAYDPESPAANTGGTILEAVTKDQLHTGLNGQIRYRISEHNLYAYLFGVNRPVTHVMGYFVSILRERIANFEAPISRQLEAEEKPGLPTAVIGISINDLRKNATPWICGWTSSISAASR